MIKFKSIKSKLMTMIGLVVTLCFTITLSFITIQTSNFAKEAGFNQASKIAENYAGRVSSMIDVGLDDIRTLSEAFEVINSSQATNPETLEAVLEKVTAQDKSFVNIWTLWENTNPDIQPYELSDSKIKSVYDLCKLSNSEIITDPYFKDINGKSEYMTTLAVPIKHDGEFMGAIGLEISLAPMQEKIKGERVFDSGYIAVVSNKGTYVAHKDDDHIGKDIGNTKERLEAKEAIKKGEYFHAIITSNSTGAKVDRHFSPVVVGHMDTPWSVAVSAPLSEVIEEANSMRNYAIMLGIASILITLSIVYLLINNITKPIVKTTSMLKDISQGEGDLTKRLEVLGEDEIGELSSYFNSFIQKIQELISQVKDNAAVLAESSSQITLAMDESNRGIAEMTDGISNIAESSQTNADIVSHTNVQIGELTESAEKISYESGQTFESSQMALESVNLGAQNIREVVDANSRVKEATTTVYESIGDLKISSDKVGDIVSMINAISEQTNLLALNASIEAARAGEHGRGFAVVADEVRKLAEESRSSSEEIATLVKDIQKKAEHANIAIMEGQSLVDKSVDKSNIINDHFESIMSTVYSMNQKIASISDLSKKQSEVAIEMNGSMQEISTSTQENVTSVHQINAVIEEQSASFEEITASVEELNNMAMNLKSETNQFKV